MHEIDKIIINFDPSKMMALNIIMGFLMFGIALDVKIEDFKQIRETPRPIFAGMLCQYILFPLLTLGMIYVMQPPTSVALGMILVSACPSGNMANYLTHRARGNVALSVTLNSLTVLLASVATPLVFGFWAKFVPGFDTFSSSISIPFGDVVKIISQVILMPLLIGMFLAHRFPIFVEKIKKYVGTVSVVVFFAFLIGAIVNNWDNVIQHLDKVFMMVLVHNALALGMGYGVATIFSLTEADRRTITIESGVHNTALGLILIFNFFDGIGGMAMIAAWWGIWDLIAPVGLIEYWRRRSV